MVTNIVIPIAGKAQRFVDKGFTAPKPLIMVGNKHMIDWAMDSIDYVGCRLIFIVRSDHVRNFSIDKVLKNKFPDNEVEIIILEEITRGTLETCLAAEHIINNEEPLVIYTPDVCFEPVFYPSMVENISVDGLILTFKANSPDHSYALINNSGYVVKTVEKEVISEHAAVGVYCFTHGRDFVRHANDMIFDNDTVNGEFYVCPIYNRFKDGNGIVIEQVRKMHVLGTPEDLEFFNKRVLPIFGEKPIALCSDHSGFDSKEVFKSVLDTLEISYIDFGTYTTTDCDHYDHLSQVVRHINNDICDFGVAFCRTGQGFNIAANKAKGIRSALIIDEYTAEFAVRHNAANFFCMPSKYIYDSAGMLSVITTIRNNSFDGGRHMTRIRRIEKDKELFND